MSTTAEHSSEWAHVSSTRGPWSRAGWAGAVRRRIRDVEQPRSVEGVPRLRGSEVASESRGRRAHVAFGRLTPRQREVLALMAQGHSNAAIARRLVISEKAVVRHTSHIYDRLDLVTDADGHRRVRAVLRFLAAHRLADRILQSSDEVLHRGPP